MPPRNDSVSQSGPKFKDQIKDEAHETIHTNLAQAPDSSGLNFAQERKAATTRATQELVDTNVLPDAQIASTAHPAESAAAPPADTSRNELRSIQRVDPSEAPTALATPAAPETPKELLGGKLPVESEKLVPGKPTVLVIDDFHASAGGQNGGVGISHGDVSARAIERDGWGVIRVDNKQEPSQALKTIADAVESGQLPLKKGDFVNMSYGTDAWRFGEAASANNLKDSSGQPLTLNEDNFASHKQELLNVLQSQPGAYNVGYDAIQRLNKLGIKVVNAEAEITGRQQGFEGGPGSFDPEYLNSNYSLKAVDPSGKPEPFSSGYKDTDNAGLGEYQLQYSRKKDGTGSYDLVGKGKVFESFSADEVGRRVPPKSDESYKFGISIDAGGLPKVSKTEVPVTVDSDGTTHQTIDIIYGTSFANLDLFKRLSEQGQ